MVADLAELTYSGHSPAGELPSALRETNRIIARLSHGVPAVFLDYDGTLTPIVEDPDRADLDDSVRQTLTRLAGHWFTAVISGRDLGDIRQRVGLDNLVYAGSHGFEISSGRSYFDDHPEGEEYLSELDSAEANLKDYAADIAGVRIERKKFAIAVHYRRADEEAVPVLEAEVDEVVSRFARLRKTTGKKIFELRPAVDWDKGRAIRAVIEQYHLDRSRVIPLYIGDDTTDEDAFTVVNSDRGISIRVGSDGQETAAQYRLRDPDEVAEFLQRLTELADRDDSGDPWTLVYEEYRPEREKLRESICTLGNGYFASRGAAPESRAGRGHYPGTYTAGCYNRLKSTVAGKTIENESMVNVPNWLSLSFRLDDGEWFDTSTIKPEKYRQELDMKKGVLIRRITFFDAEKRRISLTERRLVSMDSPHLAGLQVEITVSNWSGNLHVHSALDGRVENTLVERYRSLNNKHLRQPDSGVADETILWLQAETSQSHIRIAEACRTRLFVGGKEAEAKRRIDRESGYIAEELTVPGKAGEVMRIEKIAALYTSRDRAISESLTEARHAVAIAPDFSILQGKHAEAWRHLWRRCSFDVRMRDDGIIRVLNLHIFHLLQTVSVHSIDLDAGVPPRGLHGEAYRGLIMWDEIFVFPFLNLRIPDITRGLLKYRYRRLHRARQAAAEAGFRGAMFPWQSGSNGREEAQTLHLNPQSGRWIPDNTQLQRHINIAVAYNVWLYYQVSGDLDFMTFYGAELIVETARFFASAAAYNPQTDRYEICGVMGPDEFHTGYPWRDEPGLDNNAYTNIMVVWLMCRAMEVLELLPAGRLQSLKENLSLEEQEVETWEAISRRMYVGFHGEGIISQFQGYDRLEEFDWEKYREKYGDIHRLDRILEAENDTPNRYKLSKQADVLMLFFLLSAEELAGIFERLGYPYEYETIPRNIDYYLQRTSHGSSLSRVVHAWVLARSKRKQSWNLFCEALRSDIRDIQGGTTHEGIHLGAMAGTVDLVQRCYTGLETRGDVLRFNPVLPEEMQELTFNILYRHHRLQVRITTRILTIASMDKDHGAIRVQVGAEMKELEPGRFLRFHLSKAVGSRTG